MPPLFLQWRITTGNPLSRPKERAWKRGCFLLDSNHAISWEHRNNFNRNFESRYVAHSLKQQVNLKSYWYLDAPTSSTLSPEQEMGKQTVHSQLWRSVGRLSPKRAGRQLESGRPVFPLTDVNIWSAPM